MSLHLSIRLAMFLAICILSSVYALRLHPSLMIICYTISFLVFIQRPNGLSYLRTHLLFQLPFGLLSVLPYLDAIVSGNFKPDQGYGRGQGGQGNVREHMCCCADTWADMARCNSERN